MMAMTALCCIMWTSGSATLDNATLVVDFSIETLPEFVGFNDAHHQYGLEDAADRGAGSITFGTTDWPHLYLRAPEEGWDWSEYAGIGIQLRNPSEEPIPIAMRLDNAGADGWRACNTLRATAAPGKTFEFMMRFRTSDEERLWGMRGIPGPAQYGEGDLLDLRRITQFQLFLPKPQHAHTLILYTIYLIKRLDAHIPMPFVDSFGQYQHATWPGKVQTAEEWEQRSRKEQMDWEETPALSDRDGFGGWLYGPQREATGWFRTEKIEDKWWLITPEGRLFFSLGVNCVGTWEQTFIQRREHWFEWLPDKEDPVFRAARSHVSGAHSMAEPIGGSGDTFNFYRANLIRKYGENWPESWRNSVYRRLRHWGFNTIANWSQGDVLEHSNLPFVASTHLSGVRLVEGAKGYWSKMMDVYDPSFPEKVESAVAAIGAKFRNNPYCMGYYVDNELAWEGVVEGVLASEPEQPARQELYAFLQRRYATCDALNQAWGTTLQSWDDLAPAAATLEQARQDLSDFFYAFALRYFATIRETVRRHAPHQLYLGCRFAAAPQEAVRACADTADVVTFNIYKTTVAADFHTGEKDLGKPLMIGEFHFGALDRGMFHTGLVGTENQEERAAAYVRYVESVLDHPAFVGCHWFQYVDEPITGRWYDGENYNIGFLDVTDTPYPELTKAAQQVHKTAYSRRYHTK